MTKIDDHYIANLLSRGMKHLRYQQILMINEALGFIGEFGEVHLKVENGRLRFLTTQTSHDALKYQPGRLSHEG